MESFEKVVAESREAEIYISAADLRKAFAWLITGSGWSAVSAASVGVIEAYGFLAAFLLNFCLIFMTSLSLRVLSLLTGSPKSFSFFSEKNLLAYFAISSSLFSSYSCAHS